MTEDGLCALCGRPEASERLPQPPGEALGVCARCTRSRGSEPLHTWLRRIRFDEPDLWLDITYHHLLERSPLSRLVATIRDETLPPGE